MDGDRTKSDNYRCISPVISKIFEMVLMQIFSSQLQSDHLQYGFKRNSSCSQAIYTLRTVVERHIKSDSTVTLCALDIFKAFDRVDHFALLQLLLDRHLPNNFVTLSPYFITVLKCNIYVRWARIPLRFVLM